MERKPTAPVPAPAPLLSAGLLLARNHIYTMAWLDRDLFVSGRFGELTPQLQVGEPLSSGLPVLADYEDDIHALPCDGSTSFELPGIMLIDADGTPAPRIDIVIFRHTAVVAADNPASTNGSEEIHSEDNGCEFLLLVTRPGTHSTEVAVARLQRDRHMLLEDIEQKKLELDRVNAELEITNRDLEDFATVISHDLKAPMRALRYLAEDIEKAIDDDEPEAARTACEALKKQSRRMSTMLSELLDYASVGRKKEILEPCDTRALVEGISASLPRPAGMNLHIGGQWPVIETYVAPLDLVVRNLIDNAIKHHDRPDASTIGINATTSTDTLEISIEDDGPGIPATLQEAVFYPFRSFSRQSSAAHPENTESSHGMGLAFVKRTIEAVGGRLSLTSAPEWSRGSTFRVSWPLKLD
ncbi:MAG: HAMP domain-containing histidine kinase [Alphaproteobacteria bacterium]|nr:HAMP domain-containing histidine kinase [Alphaproteobacteria bacterium]